MTQTISQNVGDLNTMISNLETTSSLYVKQPLSTLYYDCSNVFNTSNNAGIGTITEKELTEDDVKNEIDCITNRLAELIDIIIKNGWQNKQWAIDGADKLNELSVKY